MAAHPDVPTFKVVLVGDSNVGKTALFRRLRGDSAQATAKGTYSATISADFARRTVFSCGQDLQLQIWDTAGQERFLSLTQSYLRGAAAALVVFDLTTRESFEHLDRWFRCTQVEPNMVLLLIGNKSDLGDQRKVSYEEGQRMANARSIPFFEINTVMEKNLPVDLLLTNLAQEILNRNSLRSLSSSGNGQVGLPNALYESYAPEPSTSKRSTCCW